MIQILDKTQCCGCTACENKCPKHCITMKEDFEGFLYPDVNNSECVQCGLCETVCPVLNFVKQPSAKKESYVLRCKNRDNLMNSTSGGFFTDFAEWIIEQDGYVCAAAYDANFHVTHSIVHHSGSALQRFRGSKYVQSNLADSYAKIQALLTQEKLVGFVGTTCQVEGLKSFLGKEYPKLITVDLVCHGTPSPKLWSKYIQYQKEKYHSDIETVSFRNKTYGYHSSTMKIVFQNGKKYCGSARVDYMLKSFFAEIASRPICYQCPFKQLERKSDITIYDCWHAKELVQGLKDDDRGYTNLIIQSQNGKNVWNQIKNRYEYYEADTAAAVELDGVMVDKPAAPHSRRSEFFVDFENKALPNHIQKFISISWKDRIIEKLKGVLFRLGLLNILKNAKSEIIR